MSIRPTTSTTDTRPVAGSRAEREATQRWWLLWVYGPAMTVLGAGAVVAAGTGDGDSFFGTVLVGLIVGSLFGAVFRFRAQLRQTGGLAQDEREETSAMRSMGYGYCFVYFGVLAWAVAWVGFDGSGAPEPFYALGALAAETRNRG